MYLSITILNDLSITDFRLLFQSALLSFLNLSFGLLARTLANARNLTQTT